MIKSYFKRNIDATLTDWTREKSRKPLLLRGMRQVGKTSAIRTLGGHFKHYVEINFDNDEDAGKFFNGNPEPAELCRNLSLYKHTPVIPGETLLFFDEFQCCTGAIK